MADAKKDDKNNAAAEPKKTNPLIGKLIIALFMGAVILGECVLAYFFIPDPQEVAALAQERIAEKMLATQKDEEPSTSHDKKTLEVDLGDFDVTAHHPVSNTNLRISFHLWGTIGSSERDDFDTLKSANEHRLRDRVIFEIRNAEVADLTDPGLGLIKRRILEKSNALLGKPILKSVVFSDFAFVDQ